MSTGAGPGAGVIASGVIQVNADLTNFATAIGKIPDSMRSQARAAMSALQKELAKVTADIKKNSAMPTPDMAAAKAQATEFIRLTKIQQELQAAIRQVSQETQREAAATQAATQAAKAKAQATRDGAKAARDAARAADQQAKVQATQAKQAAQAQASQAKQAAQAQAAQERLDAQAARASQGTSSGSGTASPTRQKGTRGGNVGYGILLFSQAVEDAQYGLSAIVNNIPGLALALGAGTGVAGAASLAAVAISQLSSRMGSFKEMMGTTYIKSVSQEIEELGKVADKTGEQMRRLQSLERLAGSMKAQQEGERSRDTERRSEVNHAVVEAGYANVKAGVDKLHGNAFQNGIDQNLVEELRDARGFLAAKMERKSKGTDYEEGPLFDFMGTSQKALTDKVKAAQEKVNKAYGEQVGKFIGDLAENPASLDHFIKKLEENPSAFGGTTQGKKLLEDLKEARKSPEEKQDERNEVTQQHEQERFNSHLVQMETDRIDAMSENIRDAILSGKDSGGIFGGLVGGKDGALSEKELTAKVATAMRTLGESEENIAMLARGIVLGINQEAGIQAKKDAANRGITPQRAALEIAQNARIRDKEADINRRFQNPVRDEENLDRQIDAMKRNNERREGFIGAPRPAEGGPLLRDQKKPFAGVAMMAARANQARADARKKITRDRMNEKVRTRKLSATPRGQEVLRDEATKEAARLLAKPDGKIKIEDDAALNAGTEANKQTAANTGKALTILEACQQALDKLNGGVPAVIGK